MWIRVNSLSYFSKILWIAVIVLTSNISLADDKLRFDMHIAFRGYAEKELEQWTKNHTDILKAKNLFRPRFGVFAQSPHCAKQNYSHESEIPTFTVNFFAQSPKEAAEIVSNVVDMIRTNSILKRAFLRARAEGQWTSTLYDPESKTLHPGSPYDLDPDLFPSRVEGHEYFDAHIHLMGIKDEATYTEAARLASKFSMPIIANVLKKIPKPFLTVRWYNTTREEAFKELEKIYQTLYPAYQKMGIQMARAPEFEVTLFDPDCQVTDAGWMPTPATPFHLEERRFEPSPRVFNGAKETKSERGYHCTIQ